MKLSKHYSNEMVDQGRAIARGISDENAYTQKNMAKAGRRKQTMLENAAEKALGGEGVKFNAPDNY